MELHGSGPKTTINDLPLQQEEPKWDHQPLQQLLTSMQLSEFVLSAPSSLMVSRLFLSSLHAHNQKYCDSNLRFTLQQLHLDEPKHLPQS
jgi:hypothetical protein